MKVIGDDIGAGRRVSPTTEAGEVLALARALMMRTAQELRCSACELLDELRDFPVGPEPDMGLRDISHRLAAVALLQDRLIGHGTEEDVSLTETMVEVCKALALCSRSPSSAGLTVRTSHGSVSRPVLRHILTVLLPMLTGECGWGIVGTHEALFVDVAVGSDAVTIEVHDLGERAPDRERLGGRTLLEAVWATGGGFVPPGGGPRNRGASTTSTAGASGWIGVAVRLPLPVTGYRCVGNA